METSYPSPFNCGAGVGVISVDTAGNYYPCSKFIGMEQWRIGNVRSGLDENKVREIWSRYITAVHRTCSKCWAYPICHGPCIWECAINNGDVKFDSKLCHFVQKLIEHTAYLVFKTQKVEIEFSDTNIDNCL